MQDKPTQERDYTQSFNFIYGVLDDNTIWIRTPSKYFLRVSPLTLQVLIDLNNGVTQSIVCQKYNIPEDDLYYTVNKLKLAGGMSESGQGRIKPGKKIKDITLIPYLILLGILGAIQIWYFHFVARTHYLRNWLDGALVIGIIIIAAFIHELGHYLFAKPYYRARLGFTLLLIFPVLYRDTQESWMLPRNIRILISLGGLIFDFLTNTIAVLIVLIHRPLEYYVTPFLITQYIRLFIVLNPLFPTDGYWILSDWMRTINLRKVSFWNLKKLKFNFYSLYAFFSILFLIYVVKRIMILLGYFFGVFRK